MVQLLTDGVLKRVLEAATAPDLLEEKQISVLKQDAFD